jgi:transcriptional antiterminator NusG
MGTYKGSLNSCTSSFVDGTNDREAYPKRWIAVLVQVNCEKKTAIKLGKAGYETYVPVQKEVHQWSDRKKKIDRLLLPMIVFVRATSVEEIWLRDQSFIHKLIALPGSAEDKKKFATPIPDCQIERLKFLLENAETEVTIVGELKVGDTVRVVSGPLKGITGYIESTGNLNMLLVDIGLLGCARVRMEKSKLRKI